MTRIVENRSGVLVSIEAAAASAGFGDAGRIPELDAAGLLDPSFFPTMGLTVTAGQALGGHRAVYIADDGKAYYGNPDATCRVVSGVTTGAALSGAAVTIQTAGEVVEPSWSWSDTGPVWLAADGQLTQTLPTTGYLFQVGLPMGPTRLRIEPQIVAQIT